MNMSLRVMGGVALLAGAVLTGPARAAVMEYGDENLLGTGTYPIDPKTGATLEGLAPGVVTFGAPGVHHDSPFTPAAGEYPGTDQIYVGSIQTGFRDGYSFATSRINGPQIFNLDYSSLVPAGSVIDSLTLGIAGDDIQGAVFNPYTATINGATDAGLTGLLNSLNLTGPSAKFFTIGIQPDTLTADHVLHLAIDQGGDGGDGWAVDFLTVGVTTRQGTVPEPASLGVIAVGGLVLLLRRKA